MYRIRNFLICLVLLAVAGILHHEYLRMSGSSLIATPASAAVLSNGSGQSCAGTGIFHFVNNQTQNQCGPLTATFNCGGTIEDFTVDASKCLNSTDQYFVSTPAGCTLLSATTGSQPGRLVLSDFTCTVPTPTPTPTPNPSPTPAPSPSPTI
jgi:hypothetical protein